MNDKELLERAAKAAGIDGKQDHYGVWIKGSYDAGCTVWNPLTDDGDALRLAVKLKLNIHQGNESVWIEDERNIDITDFNQPDPYAATRRAIVRAAAEIGKEMK